VQRMQQSRRTRERCVMATFFQVIMDLAGVVKTA